MNHLVQNFYSLENEKAIQVEYIWIDGKQGLRSKTKTVYTKPCDPSDLPAWNYDGSSTFQAAGKDSEVTMIPRAIYRDPFRRGNHILAMCDTYDGNGKPLESNNRATSSEIFAKAIDEKPWYGLEQEYTLFSMKTGKPLGWPKKNGLPAPQGPYYCGVGADVAYGRDIVEAHYSACLFAGIKISGCNAEVMPGQWEYQVGPVEGIEAGDQLWVSRYILLRVAELFNVRVSFDPKPVEGWNGSGMHTNFSTKKMREEDGIQQIYAAIDKLQKKHLDHIAVYGTGNEKRLTGMFETSSIDKFSAGVANRGASIRIPRECAIKKCGYLEDRRPSANCDPYIVTSKILETVLGL